MRRYLVTVERCDERTDRQPCWRVDVADNNGNVFAREHYLTDADAEGRAARLRVAAREIERLHLDYLDPADLFLTAN